MMSIRKQRVFEVVSVVIALVSVLLVYGAIPGVATPTLGQALWTTSFSQSFANEGFFSIHAHNFGYPALATIPFGLAGAVPCGWMIRLGMSPADAYTSMVAAWLVVAFAGAVAVSLRLGVSVAMAVCVSALWLCMPMVWAHVDYSMLSLGMALMPTYVWGTLRSLDVIDRRGAVLLVASALVAAFMDGYTFVMFAFCASALVLGTLFSRKSSEARIHLVRRVVPMHLLAFGIALIAYKEYVGGGAYDAAPLEMFRAWGMDVAFALIPSRGEFWFWDLIHLAVPRTANSFYGDASVWTTTFAAPLLFVAIVAAWRVRRHTLTVTLVAVAVLALYLSLGPSLKIDSRKASNDPNEVMMPADAAIAPTGSAFLSMHVPGFRLMRASYRWAMLAYLACWLLLVIALGKSRLGRPLIAYIVVALLVVMFFPHPARALRAGRLYREMMTSIDAEWVGSLRDAHVGPLIAFAPHGNDFLAAYAAARLNVVTFNAGGDKNAEEAASSWPHEMLRLVDPSEPSAAASIGQFLLHGTGDQVILPYVDLLASAHFWPCAPKESLDRSSDRRAGKVSSECAVDTRQQYAGTIGALRASPYFDVDDRTFFAVVSLKPAYAGKAGRDRAQRELLSSIRYPVDVAADVNATRLLLGEGWNPVEPVNRWSQSEATLALPATASCTRDGCKVVIRFIAFAASPTRPVTVSMRMTDRVDSSVSLTLFDQNEHDLALTIPEGQSVIALTVDVPLATSPLALGMSPDARVLGISLRRIELVRSP